jgi:outer membrane receptor protein involved in Fe transport
VTGALNNGIGWALGAQYREEERTVTPFDLTNLHLNPCQSERENIEFRNSGRTYNADGRNCAGEDGVFGGGNAADDYTGSGPYYFRGGTTPFDGSQDIIALFAEAQWSPSDELEVQLSARFEDYGGKTGNSFDPKVAVRYEATDNVTLRGSASSTFRGPTLNQLDDGRVTTLSLVSAVGVYKAIDTFGDPALDPETADTLNLGALFDYEDVFSAGDNLRFGIDYWSFDFSDPVIVESFNAIVEAAFEGGAMAADAPYRDRITCGAGTGDACVGTAAADLERVRVNIINGPDIETDGYDMTIGYDVVVGRGDLNLDFQWTRVNSYDVAPSDLDADGHDALGNVNNNVSFLRPVIEDKYKLSGRYAIDAHSVNLVWSHTADYTGNYGGSSTAFTTESHDTYDLHYNLSLAALNPELENSAFWVSVYNLTDEDPPFTPLDLNYDPYTHNPFGQMIKVGVRHSF